MGLAALNNTLNSVYTCLYSTVHLPDASLASVEVLLRFSQKDRNGGRTGKQANIGFQLGMFSPFVPVLDHFYLT